MIAKLTRGSETMLCFATILFCVQEVFTSPGSDDQLSDLLLRKSTRERRSLVYLTAPLLQLSIAFTTPYNIPKRPMQISYGFQLNFQLPTNVSEIEPFPRNRRDVSKASSFLELESFLESRGFEGRECLLRSICELASSPLDRGDRDGMMEEVLHALLTPSEEFGPLERYSVRPHDHDIHQEFRFLNAELIGQSGGDCFNTFPYCHQSPLELITEQIRTA